MTIPIPAIVSTQHNTMKKHCGLLSSVIRLLGLISCLITLVFAVFVSLLSCVHCPAEISSETLDKCATGPLHHTCLHHAQLCNYVLDPD